MIPCLVRNLTDDEVLVIQIQENALRPETTPTDYARQCRRILDSRPEMREYELASLLNKSPRWIGQILGLERLQPEFQTAVERGEMPLGSAYELVHIPHNHRPQFFDAARTLPEVEFRALRARLLEEIHGVVAARQVGRLFHGGFCSPGSHEAVEGGPGGARQAAGRGLGPGGGELQDRASGLCAALTWVLHLDRDSVEASHEAFLSRNRKKEVFGKQF